MSSVLVYAVFLLIPLAAITAFAVCLIRFCIARKRHKAIMDSFSLKRLRGARIAMIVTAAVAGGLVVTMVSFIALVYFLLIFVGM